MLAYFRGQQYYQEENKSQMVTPQPSAPLSQLSGSEQTRVYQAGAPSARQPSSLPGSC